MGEPSSERFSTYLMKIPHHLMLGFPSALLVIPHLVFLEMDAVFKRRVITDADTLSSNRGNYSNRSHDLRGATHPPSNWEVEKAFEDGSTTYRGSSTLHVAELSQRVWVRETRIENLRPVPIGLQNSNPLSPVQNLQVLVEIEARAEASNQNDALYVISSSVFEGLARWYQTFTLSCLFLASRT